MNEQNIDTLSNTHNELNTDIHEKVFNILIKLPYNGKTRPEKPPEITDKLLDDILITISGFEIEDLDYDHKWDLYSKLIFPEDIDFQSEEEKQIVKTILSVRSEKKIRLKSQFSVQNET